MKIVTLHYETERHTGRASLIGILINKKIETEKTSFANGGPYKTLSGLSCKAGGLQRRRALKSCILGVSSHHRYGLFCVRTFRATGERVGIARFSQGVSVELVLSGNAMNAECSDSFEHGFYGYNGFRRLLLLVGSIN